MRSDSDEDERGDVGGELAGGPVRHGEPLEVGGDLFDNGVPATGLVRGNGVQLLVRDGCEERWKRHPSNRLPCQAALFRSALASGMPRTTRRPGMSLTGC